MYEEQQFRMRARLGPFYLGQDNIEVFAYQIGSGCSFAAKKLEFVQCTSEQINTPLEPFVKLERDEAQVLMDDLWEAGIRPTEGKGSTGSMKAMEKHLEDMQRIAFHLLKIQPK